MLRVSTAGAIMLALVGGAAAGEAQGIGCATTAPRRSASRPAARRPLRIYHLAQGSGQPGACRPAGLLRHEAGSASWTVTAFNPTTARPIGKMSLSGERLATAGCVFGGLICKSFTWARAK